MKPVQPILRSVFALLPVPCLATLIAGCYKERDADPVPTSPKITTVEPAEGPIAGSIEITLYGERFSVGGTTAVPAQEAVQVQVPASQEWPGAQVPQALPQPSSPQSRLLQSGTQISGPVSVAVSVPESASESCVEPLSWLAPES